MVMVAAIESVGIGVKRQGGFRPFDYSLGSGKVDVVIPSQHEIRAPWLLKGSCA